MEKINGRTPEEIKRGLRWIARDCSEYGEDCSECECVEECHKLVEDDVAKDALAYIERLEAAQPKWISVKERLPTEEDVTDERKIICVPSKLYGSMAGNVRIYPWDIVASYSSLFTHWMPLPEPPEEDAE